MAAPIAALCERAPARVLAVLVLLTIALGAYAVGVPDRLGIGGGATGGSQSEEADAILSAELGYEAEPAYLIALAGVEPITTSSNEIAVETVRSQIEAIGGVAAVLGGEASEDGQTATLAIHSVLDPSPASLAEIGEQLRTGIDPGPLEVFVGGSVATQEGARSAALDEAPKLLLLGLPLLLLLLVGSLGLRPALAALLAALLATASTLAVIGLLNELTTISAVAATGAAILAAVMATEAAAALLFRYREEAATLGSGPETIEYSLHNLLWAAAIGMFSAALVGAALFVIPIEFVRSIGAGVVVAALLAPPLGMLAMAAMLSTGADRQIGGALPLVSDDARVEAAPLAFRAFLSLGRARRQGLVAILPVMAIAALALPVLDSEAIGLDPAELPADQPAAVAGAEITGAFGPGANGPLTVLSKGPGEAPTVVIYREAIDRLEEVASVSRALTVGKYAAFDADPAARPQSLAGERTVADIRAVPAPSRQRVTGPGAELSDSAERLAGDLPLVALVALLGTAALWSLLFRSAFGPLLALAAVIAPLAGLAAMLAVFSYGRLSGLLDYQDSGAPHLQSFVIVGTVLLAVGLARGAGFASALREERALGGGAAGSLARSGLLTLMPSAVASFAGVVVAGVWLGSDLLAAKEIALGLSAGLLADLLIARALLAPALARLSL